MKKLISLILILCMACMLIPAMAEDAAGEWYLKSMSYGGQTMDVTGFCMSGTLNLKEDGTYTMAMTGSDESTGTWKADGDKIQLEVSGSTANVTLADGTLTITDEATGTAMVFSREAPAAAYVPAEVNADAKLEDFTGTWGIAYIGMNGIVVDLNAFVQSLAAMMPEGTEMPDIAAAMALKIDGTKVTIGDSTEEAKTIEGSFADGKITVKEEESGTEITLSLLQDGYLAMDTEVNGQAGTIYCAPAAAAEEPAA